MIYLCLERSQNASKTCDERENDLQIHKIRIIWCESSFLNTKQLINKGLKVSAAVADEHLIIVQ